MASRVHPTYGDFDKFLATVERDVKRGFLLHHKQLDAFNWYSQQYSLCYVGGCKESGTDVHNDNRVCREHKRSLMAAEGYDGG